MAAAGELAAWFVVALAAGNDPQKARVARGTLAFFRSGELLTAAQPETSSAQAVATTSDQKEVIIMKTQQKFTSGHNRIGSKQEPSKKLSQTARTRRLLLVATLACLWISLPAAAQNYSFRIVDVPGSSSSRVLGNTNADVLVGDYGTTKLTVNSGYVLANGTFTRIAFPGASMTFAEGINNHLQVVGGYSDPSGKQHGFLLSGGVYRTLDFPGAINTFGGALNDVGIVVGTYDDGSRLHGFSARCNPGGLCSQFTTIDFPGSACTAPNGVNNAGQIVGDYSLTDPYLLHDWHGYLQDVNNFAKIDFPGALETAAYGLNNAGEIVGDYLDSSKAYHGYTYINQSYATFDVPGAPNTYASAINDAGQIVGERDAQGFDQDYGFLATPINGQDNLSASSEHGRGKQQ
jgi:uncharacterized membrane protein